MNNLISDKELNALHTVTQKITADIAKTYQMVGMIQMSDFTRKLVDLTTLKILAEIKETKRYKGLELINKDGELITVTTFRDFCKTIGLSGETVDRNLLNLKVLGEEFFETSRRLGLSYREMGKIRQLPEEARSEIINTDYSKSEDKDELLEKLEDLTVQYYKENSELKEQLQRKTEDYEAQSRVLANKDKHLNRLDVELQKTKTFIENIAPDEEVELLREELAKKFYSAEVILRGSARQIIKKLDERKIDVNEHCKFIEGLIICIEDVLIELREAYVQKYATETYTPEWAKGDNFLDTQE